MAAHKRAEYGEYIVSDPEICGGDFTFKGTRVLVRDVLYYVAQGMDWEEIAAGYRGTISPAGIAEAIAIANETLHETAESRRRAA